MLDKVASDQSQTYMLSAHYFRSQSCRSHEAMLLRSPFKLLIIATVLREHCWFANAQGVMCSLCNGYPVPYPYIVIQMYDMQGTLAQYSCLDLDNYGLSGYYNAEECDDLKQYAAPMCGCPYQTPIAPPYPPPTMQPSEPNPPQPTSQATDPNPAPNKPSLPYQAPTIKPGLYPTPPIYPTESPITGEIIGYILGGLAALFAAGFTAYRCVFNNHGTFNVFNFSFRG